MSDERKSGSLAWLYSLLASWVGLLDTDPGRSTMTCFLTQTGVHG